MSQAVYERARLSRDSRFDGQFFVGVTTTGIYCRPVCPATPPNPENVVFYPTAAAAGEAGFRPCLRCRPECAPGTPAWAGTSTTVRRGLRLIAEGALEEGNVERLAERLGVTSRHLRRLFTTHLGASPQAIAHTQRLHFAKRLIDETSMPMQEIATAAGYGSVRRFNDTFRKTYGRPPRELRRHTRVPANTLSSGLSLRLSYRQPFDWQSMLDFFAARSIRGIESVRDDCYRRAIKLDGSAGVITLRNDAAGGALLLSLHGASTGALFPLVQRTREVFDLDAPIGDIMSVLRADDRLGRLLEQRPGIRVPGAWDGFELAVRAILGQQISVKAARTLAGRIVERYGERVRLDEGAPADTPDRLFPTPKVLMRARFNDVGLVASRAATIRRVAQAVVDGDISFESSQDSDEFCRSIVAIRGIGEWTAQYVAMRALKNPDAFPASDLGLLRAFDEPASERMRPGDLELRAENWRPWRSYAALLLWSRSSGSGG